VSVLNELSTAQTSGSVVSSAQPTRNAWDSTGVRRARSAGTEAVSGGRRVVVRTAIYSSTRSRRVTRRKTAATDSVRKNIATPIADA
jgi:hypothetical protein